MFHKVKEVKAIEEYVLEVEFYDGIIKKYDVSPLFEKWKVFEQLKTEDGLFKQVKVDQGGYGISWNDEIDLSCEELWNNGIAQ
ncbi:MAG: DUF2442 domain-containing protein [Clostridia bacterium]|nr:DUF2442 domain-containing protein [Clostridia bacterium]